MKRPNLFILGAPKCGTTALATWLSIHPEIFISSVKEPHHFSTEYQLTYPLSQYEALFQDASAKHIWVAEASVWYLYSPNAIRNILKYDENARFVVMLRNPLEMVPSMHEQQRFNGNELIPNLEEALSKNNYRLQGQHLGVRQGYPADHLAYLNSCALGWQLERAMSIIPQDSLHVIFHDDLKESNEKEYRRLLMFLNVDAFVPSSFEIINGAKTRKSFTLDRLVRAAADLKSSFGVQTKFGLLSSVRRWNRAERPREACPPKIKEQLLNALDSDMKLLESLTERTLDWRSF